jgi:hypothetical protein
MQHSKPKIIPDIFLLSRAKEIDFYTDKGALLVGLSLGQTTTKETLEILR